LREELFIKTVRVALTGWLLYEKQIRWRLGYGVWGYSWLWQVNAFVLVRTSVKRLIPSLVLKRSVGVLHHVGGVCARRIVGILLGYVIRVVHASPIRPQLVPQLGLNFDLNLQDLNFPNRKFSRVEVKVEAF
jgi:hypothetical protein